jgi:hypothetical protein
VIDRRAFRTIVAAILAAFGLIVLFVLLLVQLDGPFS